MTFDDESLTISGTPEDPQDLTRYVFRAIDADGDVVGLAFTLKVLEDRMPSFDEGVEDHIWTQDSSIGTLELPVAEGGNGVDGTEGLLSYTLSPDLPEGLMFEGTRQRIRGTPAVPMDETTFTYTATDNDGDSVDLTFSLTVLEDLMPSFSEEVRNQAWTQDSEIEPIELPQASGGNVELSGELVYTLTPDLPAGVTLNDGTISGTPTVAQELTRYVYRATDADGDVAGVAFWVVVAEDLMPAVHRRRGGPGLHHRCRDCGLGAAGSHQRQRSPGLHADSRFAWRVCRSTRRRERSRAPRRWPRSATEYTYNGDRCRRGHGFVDLRTDDYPGDADGAESPA